MEDKSLNILLRLKRSPFVFPLATLAALAMIFISEGAYWQSTRSMRELGTIGEARLQLMNLSRRVVDAESGQRGYLLTGRTNTCSPIAARSSDIGPGA
jgi:CHASE3 domain sensor protein